MILANQQVLRFRLGKLREKLVPAKCLETTPEMIVFPQLRVRFAGQADFSSVHGETRCSLCCGANKVPTGQT